MTIFGIAAGVVTAFGTLFGTLTSAHLLSLSYGNSAPVVLLCNDPRRR